jgi:hypothetical protein
LLLLGRGSGDILDYGYTEKLPISLCPALAMSVKMLYNGRIELGMRYRAFADKVGE